MNELKHLPEFRRALTYYQPSQAAQALLADLKLVLLVAPTSTGRNTIIRELLKTGSYHFIISDTTRQARVNDGVPEQNGQEYWFRSEAEILREIQAGEFLEAAIIHEQQVSGISMRELQKAHDDGKIATTDIEIAGVDSIIKLKPDTLTIFMVPPSFEEWQHRLHARGVMSHHELRRRLDSACKEFEAALEHPYYTFVVNDTLTHAVQTIDELAKGATADPIAQAQARVLVQELYIHTTEFLQHIVPQSPENDGEFPTEK